MSSLTELKTSVKSLKAEMKGMEEGLRKVPFWEAFLIDKQARASYFWGEVKRIKGSLRCLTDQEKAEVESIVSVELQNCYKELNAWVNRAINDHNRDEEAQKRDAKMEEKPQKPVAKKVTKDSATGESISKKKLPKKNLLREAIKAAAKPSAEEGEKLNKAEAGESPPVDPLDQLRALRGLVEGQIEQLMAILTSPTISLSAVKTKSQDMMGAWIKYEDQYK